MYAIRSYYAAIGLGNIWRFPYTVASNGGGAFLIPYLVALLTAGIPILILEFGLGHKIRNSAPGVFGSLNKKWQVFGWWQASISFVITTYYVVVIAWAMSYFLFSFNLGWGSDPKGFLFGDFLKLTDSPMSLGGLNFKVAIRITSYNVCYTKLLRATIREMTVSLSLQELEDLSLTSCHLNHYNRMISPQCFNSTL